MDLHQKNNNNNTKVLSRNILGNSLSVCVCVYFFFNYILDIRFMYK